MVKRYILITTIVLAAFAGKLQAQKSLVKAYDALKVYNYFEARKLFKEELKKNKVTTGLDTTGKAKEVKDAHEASSAAFGLGVIYSRTDNPFFNTDTAYVYAKIADTLFRYISPKQMGKLTDSNLPPTRVTLDSLYLDIYTKAYSLIKGQTNRQLFVDYRNRFPISPFDKDAADQIETFDWSATETDNSYTAYQKFIEDYPESSRLGMAKDRYELRLYQTYTEAHTIAAYKDFIIQFPASPYNMMAQDSAFALSTTSGLVADYHSFILQNPFNRNVDKAWERLYTIYNADGSEATLKRFKNEYPDYPGADKLGRDLELAGTLLLPFEQDGKWGFIDTSGKPIIAPKFSNVELFSDGLALVDVGGKAGYINKAGVFVINAEYEEGTAFDGNYAIAKKNGLFGVIGRIGNVILPFEYDDIESVAEVKAGTAIITIASVIKGDRQGFIDLTGKIKYPMFEEVSDFYENRAVVKKDGKYGFINVYGTMVIQPLYDWVDNFKNGIARAKQGQLTGLIDTNGIVLAPFKYNLMGSFTDGLSLVTVNGISGYINSKGVEIITPEYEFATPFAYNPMVHDTIARVEWKKKRGYIFKNNKSVYQFKFDDVATPAQGLMGAKQKGKWGFVDKEQKTIIPFKFDNVGSFKNGMALATIKGKTGTIDKKGKWVLEAKYDEVYDSYGDNVLVVQLGDKYGFVDTIGAEILPIDMEEPELVTGNIYQLTKNGKIAYYNLAHRKFAWKQAGF